MNINNKAISPTQLIKLLVQLLPLKLPVLITGAPGVGKTDIVAQVRNRLEESLGACNLLVMHPVVSDPTDAKGMPWVFTDGNTPKAKFIPFGDLEQMINAKALTIVFLDDLGQAPPSVQAAFMQLILSRRINDHKVSDHVVFVAATNRKQDRAGVSGILEPVKSRFATIIELEPDLYDWIRWALDNNMPTELIFFIKLRPNLLFDFKPTSDMTNSPCPRTVANVGKLRSAGIEKEIEYQVYSGTAGEGFAAEWCGFLANYQKLMNEFNPDKILLDPDNAPVPTEPSHLYAVTLALAKKASAQTADRLFRYANRLPDEFSVLLVNQANKQSEDFVNTRAFAEWEVQHHEVMFA